MAGIKYLFTCLLLCGCLSICKAQSVSYEQADSTSYALYLSGDWQNLIKYGNTAIAEGNDFPLMRMRLAYAYFNTGNYTSAIKQYDHVLKSDSHNAIARYYAYLCNLYLNRDDMAAYHAAYLDDPVLIQKPSAFKLISLSTESSFKFTSNAYRGNSIYQRIGAKNNLGYRFTLDQSVGYFNQNLLYRKFSGGTFNTVSEPVKQWEYYGKLNYTLTSKLAVWGAYHYLNNHYQLTTYNNNLGVAGLKYAAGVFTLKGDMVFGSLTGSKVRQYDAELGIYPLGNFNLYFISKGAALDHSGAVSGVFDETVGGKVFGNFWLEANSTFGELKNYLDADGLYVYNSIDVTKFKAGGTGYHQWGRHALLFLNYTFERKNNFFTTNTYHQHSVTGGLTWKF